MVKSYVNLVDEVSNKMIMKPTIIVKHVAQIKFSDMDVEDAFNL